MPKRYGDIVGDGGSNVLAQVEELKARLRARMARVRWKVAVASGKGGVGKSVLTANLAVVLATKGWQVGVLDADLNGPSIAKVLGLRDRHLRLSGEGVHPAEGPLGVKVLSMDFFLPEGPGPLIWEAPTQQDSFVWRDSMEATVLREFLADTAWGDLDILLFDLAPGAPRLPAFAGLLGDLDGALVVTGPSELSRLAVARSVELARAHGVRLLGLVENMTGYLCPTAVPSRISFPRPVDAPSRSLGFRASDAFPSISGSPGARIAAAPTPWSIQRRPRGGLSGSWARRSVRCSGWKERGDEASLRQM